MSKVKKGARVTGKVGSRGSAGKKGASKGKRLVASTKRKTVQRGRKAATTGGRKTAAKSAARGSKKATSKSALRGSKLRKRVGGRGNGVVPKEVPEPRMDIRELNPQEKCGPDTSVQFLYRVIERGERGPTNHLVFFDQHGWYCEHGRSCPAVAPAKKHSGWAARG